MKKFFSILVVLLIVGIGDFITVYFVGFPTKETSHLWLTVLLANVGALFYPVGELIRRVKGKTGTIICSGKVRTAG